MVKKILLIIILVLAVVFIYLYLTLSPQFPIANGYAAKKMCSCIFISERTQESIQKEDLSFGPLSMTRTKIDLAAKSVTTTIFGMAPRTAVFRNAAGCILLDGPDDHQINLEIARPRLKDTVDWPLGTRIYLGEDEMVDFNLLNQAIEDAFDPSFRDGYQKTRAVLVVHRGNLIAEKYADGFGPETEILGWSITKSIVSTMIGILVKNNILSLTDTGIFPEWTDERKNISLKDMLQMQSGLAFSEDYAQISDATRMLFISEDISLIPKNNPLEHSPGTHWSYSSGTTNLLARIIRDKIADTNTYLRFPYDSIFYRLGMTSAVMETDESGNFIGSSYCYATPRDWAKFGLLYLNEGNWFGDQIIDSSWVNFVREAASASKGVYGGQFWLNAGHSNYADAPEDLFSCNGFQGQHVFIIPSHDLVIVRMGLAEYPDFNANNFLKNVLASFSIE